jgi:tetratricopeptide (TPR) repeat protein
MKFLVLLLCAMIATPALAEEADTQSQLTKAQKRAEELDSMFGKLKRNDSKYAARIWELWAQSDSITADVLLQQATLAISRQEFTAAAGILDQMAQTYPAYTEAYNKRAILHFLKGDKAKALADIDKVLDLEPRHFGALCGRGMILMEQGKDRAALAALREALAINPAMDGIKAAVRELEKRAPEL